MRKIYLMLSLYLAISVGSIAQAVSTYAFTPSSGTYTALTGGTVILTASADADDGFLNVAVGFPFTYGGTPYTNAMISSNGFIQLTNSTTATIATSNWTNSIANSAFAPLIAGIWDDNNRGPGAVSYATSGTTPNRVFSVQWAGIAIGGGGDPVNPTGTFRIDLRENGNVIISYGTISAFLNVTASIGLGNGTSYLSVTPGAPATASSTTPNNSISSNTNLTSGTIYTFVPPAITPCSGTPTAGNAVASTTILCATGSSSLSLTGTSASSGLTYQWQSSPAGANTFTNIAGANASTYNATGISASTDYRCVVTCSNGGASANSGIATVTNSGIPANDLICNAITLALNGAEHCGNTTCATSGAGEATGCSSSAPNNTVWYKFTPTVTAAYKLVMNRPAGATAAQSLAAWVGVYTLTGACPATPTFAEITQSSCLNLDVSTATTDTTVTSTLTAGTTYYFLLDGISGSFGAYCIKLQDAPVAPNCTTIISPANGSTGYNPGLSTGLSWNSVANANQYFLYVGTTNPPPTTAPFGPLTTTSISLVGFAPNTTYYWYVVPSNSGVNAIGCGSVVSSFTTAARPANDSCGAAVALTANVPTVGNTGMSSLFGGASTSCTPSLGGGGGNVWYSFNTLAGGAATVSLTGATNGLDAIVTVFSGTPAAGCTGLTEVSCADNGSANGDETVTLTGLAPGSTYYVSVSGWDISEGAFTLTVSGPALPVRLVNFSGRNQDKTNILEWTTASEANSQGFELQRSVNGTDFTALTFVNSKAVNGNSTTTLNYTYSDIQPLPGTNYYRLKQVDKDGKSSLSNVVAVKGLKPTTIQIVSVYPNPATSNLSVNIETPVSDRISFLVTDVTGKVVMNKAYSINVGDNQVDLNVSNLPAGSYFIKAVCTNGCETITTKFVKR